MKIIKDDAPVFTGSLRECVEEITDGTYLDVVKEVRQYIKRDGHCTIALGTDVYDIIK